MSTPICHRTLGPYTNGKGSAWLEDSTSSTWGQNSEGYECLGSACALWVPALKDSNPGTPAMRLNEFGERFINGEADEEYGWCADNLRRRPWLDPQAPTPDGGEE